MVERIIVIGGNAAGMTAASRAKRLNPELGVTILEESPFISYSICGLPYYIFGLVQNHQDLIQFAPEKLLKEREIQARTRTRVTEILPGRRKVSCKDLRTGQEFLLAYDRAVIATGYSPRRPPLSESNPQNIFTVSRLEDGIRIRRAIEENGWKRALVVGAGYVGLMMAHGLREMDLQVSLLDKAPRVYRQVDEEISRLIEAELIKNQIQPFLKVPMHKLSFTGGVFEGIRLRGRLIPADFALIDVGIVPNTRLAAQARIPCGLSGAICVDQRGQTSISGIYAAGNCAETIHLVSGRPLFSKLGTMAARQGRVVGENLAGQNSIFPGTLETSIEKIFDLSVARSGLTLRQALKAGFDATSVMISGWDRARYYPGASRMHVKLIFERQKGRLLGGQILGENGAGKRIDALVPALTAGMTLRQVAGLDLAYAPPSGTLWDPIQIAANVGLRQLRSSL